MTCSRLLPAFVSLLLFVPVAVAQQQQASSPHLGYIYPAGGRQGTTYQLLIGGQYLDGVTEARITGAGVKATVIEHVKPLTQGQFNNLRQKLQDLMDQRGAANRAGRSGAATKATWTAEDEKQIAEIRKKLSTFVRRPSSPSIAETVTLQITIARDAEPGERELRLQTPAGMTNPLVFCVSQLPEFLEKELKAINPPANVVAPAVLNGQIMPGEVDRIKFKARWGQKLVITASARELIPYIADAVPGWFQTTLTLYDPSGKEVAYDDDYRFNPDPVLYYEVKKDGEYTVEIKDAIYRGREDFVYRITIGELPFITSVFPLGGRVGASIDVEVKGWNLPVSKLTVDATGKSAGILPLTVQKGDRVSNRVPFVLDTLPECIEHEPNDSIENAQSVTLPIIVNGRIDKPGDRDVFRFDGKAGQEIAAEVLARRLGSPVDSEITLTDAAGKQIAFNDDFEDKAQGLETHHADSWLSAKLPADGAYYLHIADSQHAGGPDYAYRLRISAPRPDFELRVVPSAITVRGGAATPITVCAIRRDGFTGDIDIGLKDAPAGFGIGGARIPGNQDQVRMTLSAPPAPTTQPIHLNFEGRAPIQGGQLVRAALPADDMMQAFFYRHLVPAQELLVTIAGRAGPRNPGTIKILSATPVKLPAGGTAQVQVGMPTNSFFGKIFLELSDPPEGITIKDVFAGRDGSDVVIQCDAAKAKPGLKGNLILEAFLERPNATGPNGKPQANRRRAPIGTLPAIPFEVIAAPAQ